MTDRPPSVLLTATPLLGHVNPMLGLGRALRSRGFDVTLLTGAGFEALARLHGLRFAALPSQAATSGPAGRRRRLRVLAGRDDIVATFVRPLDGQHHALNRLLAQRRFDVVLSDVAFLGAIPLAFRPRTDRVPVLGASLTPLSLISVDCAPFGSGMRPGSSLWTRSRNAQANWLVHHGPLKPLHDQLDAALLPHGVPPRAFNYFNQVSAFDLVFQLGAPGMEYVRRDTPDTLRFVGPVRPAAAAEPLPPWWADLDDSRPVVHVTQGTLDNLDHRKLLLPAVRGLAEEDVLVVVSTGGRAPEELRHRLGPGLPDNLRIADYLPYAQLLPRVAAMVTNGGYGGVHEALRHGVPLVVAGDTEDKPEVAARVAWSGTGRNLRTGRPSAARLRRAVRSVLDEGSYRQRAEQLRAEIADLGDPTDTVPDTVEAVLGRTDTGYLPFRDLQPRDQRHHVRS